VTVNSVTTVIVTRPVWSNHFIVTKSRGENIQPSKYMSALLRPIALPSNQKLASISCRLCRGLFVQYGARLHVCEGYNSGQNVVKVGQKRLQKVLTHTARSKDVVLVVVGVLEDALH
jgi:hypothetical protein